MLKGLGGMAPPWLRLRVRNLRRWSTKQRCKRGALKQIYIFEGSIVTFVQKFSLLRRNAGICLFKILVRPDPKGFLIFKMRSYRDPVHKLHHCIVLFFETI